MASGDFSKHLTNYLSVYLPNDRNVSLNTISSYCDTFRLFLIFYRDSKNLKVEKLQIKDITSELVKDFLCWLEDIRKCSTSTRNQRLAAIHAFARYLLSESPQDMFSCQLILSVPYKKKIKPVITYLTPEEIKMILSMPDLSTINGRRDAVLLSVLYDSGSRVQEIVDLRAQDVRLSFPEKLALTGKGRKKREVPLMSSTATLLKQYTQEHSDYFTKNKEAPLFQNRFKQKFTRAGIAYTLDKYAQKAKVYLPTIPNSVTPHMLRHTKAMHLLESGVPIVYIRDFLGHVDISTTDIYARANVETKRQALEKASSAFSSEMPSWNKEPDLLQWLKTLSKSN